LRKVATSSPGFDGDLAVMIGTRVARRRSPFYAGAYIYGKSEHRTAIVNGRAQKTYGHGKPFDEWEVVLKDHHEGYIDWAEFERNQKQLAANAYGRVGEVKSGRGGQALLVGLLRCARCGRRLKVAYYGRKGRAYRCDNPNLIPKVICSDRCEPSCASRWR
jgi:hypothetical protein